MIKQNLGKLDRIFRFLLGFWWITPLAPIAPWEWLNWVVFVVGWIALIESFAGWCWLHELFGLKTNWQ